MNVWITNPFSNIFFFFFDPSPRILEVENAYGFAADTSLALNTVKIVWLPGCQSPVIGEAHHMFLQFLNLRHFPCFVFLQGRSFQLTANIFESGPMPTP